MKPFLILFMLLAYQLALAQHIQFNWHSCIYSSEIKRDIYNPCIVATGDGYLVSSAVETGNLIQPGDLDETDIWLVKIDSIGNFQWEKYFGGSHIDVADMIVPADSGNFYIYGTTNSIDGGATYPPYISEGGLWYIKIDGSGNKLWDRVAGSSDMVTGAGGYCIPTFDDGILSLTNIAGVGGDITTAYGQWDAWLLKINAQGDIEWDFTLGTDNQDLGGQPIQTSDKGFLIPLYGTPGENGNIICDILPQFWPVKAMLVKLDSARNIEWQQCLGASYHLSFSCALEVSDGYIIGGSAFTGDGAVEGAGYHLGYNNQGEQTGDLWIRKIDFDGNLIWQKCYGGSGHDWPMKLFKTTNGNLTVFGITCSRDGDVTGMHTDPPYLYPINEDIWMLKIDGTNGTLLWNRCIGSVEREYIDNGIIQKDDRNYYFTTRTIFGNRGDITCGDPETEYFAWVSGITDTTAYVGIHNIEDISHSIKLYPNPASDFITIEIPHQFDKQNFQATLINSEGETVMTFLLSSLRPYFNTANLASGLYLLRLENQKMKASKRFIKK